MKDKLIPLNSGGALSIDGVPHTEALLLSPFGEMTIIRMNLTTGLTTTFLLDALAGYEIHLALTSFHRGEFESEMESD